ncbi:MAG: AcrR family transcriptional regulator [Oceanicoccus sp.]|jgi:AcrR family transcriptional regulator
MALLSAMGKIKRTRLSPADRHTQLLDVTQSLILEYGLNNFTMEALATAAGVSNPLVYKYFDTRLELFQTLLLREFQRFNKQLVLEINKASNFDEVVKIVVTVNFDQQSNNGNIVQLLQNHADVEAILKTTRTRHKMAKFLVSEISERYSLTTKQAESATVMASGSSVAAAKHYKQYGGNR